MVPCGSNYALTNLNGDLFLVDGDANLQPLSVPNHGRVELSPVTLHTFYIKSYHEGFGTVSTFTCGADPGFDGSDVEESGGIGFGTIVLCLLVGVVITFVLYRAFFKKKDHASFNDGYISSNKIEKDNKAKEEKELESKKSDAIEV